MIFFRHQMDRRVSGEGVPVVTVGILSLRPFDQAERETEMKKSTVLWS